LHLINITYTGSALQYQVLLKKNPNGNNDSTDRHARQTQATYWRSHELLYEILTSTMNVMMMIIIIMS